MPSISTRNSYHTDFKIAVSYGFVPDSIVSSLPKSSKYRFIKTDYSNHIGSNDYSMILSNIDLFKRLSKQQHFINILKVIYKTKDLIFSIYNKYSEPFFTFFKKEFVRNKIVSFINSHSSYFNIASLSKLFRITLQTFYQWSQKKCSYSPLKKCYKKHPVQLTLKESNKIKEMLTDPNFKFWPIISIAYYAIRNSILFIKPRTWYKYAKLFGITRSRAYNRRNKNKIGIRASKPNQLIHADVTIFKTIDNIKCYLYFIVDNFSRKILSAVASLKLSGQIRFQTIKDTYEKFIQPDNDSAELIVDDATENNCNAVMDYVGQPTVSIKHIIAQLDIEFSNSIVEAVNKLMKYNYLFKEDIPDFETLQKKLSFYVDNYNNRPHSSLNGLTPDEAYQGACIDKAELKTQFHYAWSARLFENNLTRCQTHD